MRNPDLGCLQSGPAGVELRVQRLLALIAVSVWLVACQRESAPPPVPETTPPPAAGTPSPSLSEADLVSNQRLLDYLENLLQRKEFEQARRAVAELESRPMTPAQRQRLQQLKARLPPG